METLHPSKSELFTNHASRSLNCNLSFRKTVRESRNETARGKELLDWRGIALPPRHTNISPLTSHKKPTKYTTDEAVASIDLAPPSADAEMERKFFRRVHHIIEYLVPVQYASNNFADSRLPLIQAVGQGNIQWVRNLLLHTDTDPNCRSFQGWTALQQACSTPGRNSKAIVELLIAYGADVNATPGDCYARTALQAACEVGNEEIVDILLKEGAEINAETGPSGGNSAIAAASWAGHFGILRKLLNLGANINHPGSKDLGHTALSAATQRGNLEMFDYLVQQGAIFHGQYGSKLLEEAIFWDQLDVVSRLLELGVNVNAEVDGLASINAVRSLKLLDLLAAHGAQMSELRFRPRGCKALQRAAKFGNLDLAKELIRLGTDIHTPGPKIRGRTGLQSAASRGFWSLPAVKSLIDEYGVDVNETRSTEERYTGLEAACHYTALSESPDLGIIEILLERGAKVTPFTLHVAAACGHGALARLLL